MKRLNPETGKPFRKGDARPDGMVFYGYRTKRPLKGGAFQETWVRPTTLARAKFHHREKAYYLADRYGLSAADYGAMLDHQAGVCAICGAAACPNGGRFAVDHCHVTGSVRGLLCRDCNLALGKMKDDPARFDRAAAYLRGGGSGWQN